MILNVFCSTPEWSRGSILIEAVGETYVRFRWHINENGETLMCGKPFNTAPAPVRSPNRS